MNFVCDKCKQKYHVADEKIRGRAVTRFRCKKCENVIELRGDDLPDPEALDAPKQAESPDPRPRAATMAPTSPRPAVAAIGPGAPPDPGSVARPSRTRAPTSVGIAFNAGMAASMAKAAPRAASTSSILNASETGWYAGIRDLPVGPLTRKELITKVQSAEVTPDTLVWREGLDDWRPLRNVAELGDVLRLGAQRISGNLLDEMGRRPPPAEAPAASPVRRAAQVVPLRQPAAASIAALARPSMSDDDDEATRVTGMDPAVAALIPRTLGVPMKPAAVRPTAPLKAAAEVPQEELPTDQTLAEAPQSPLASQARALDSSFGKTGQKPPAPPPPGPRPAPPKAPLRAAPGPKFVLSKDPQPAAQPAVQPAAQPEPMPSLTIDSVVAQSPLLTVDSSPSLKVSSLPPAAAVAALAGDDELPEDLFGRKPFPQQSNAPSLESFGLSSAFSGGVPMASTPAPAPHPATAFVGAVPGHSPSLPGYGQPTAPAHRPGGLSMPVMVLMAGVLVAGVFGGVLLAGRINRPLPQTIPLPVPVAAHTPAPALPPPSVAVNEPTPAASEVAPTVAPETPVVEPDGTPGQPRAARRPNPGREAAPGISAAQAAANARALQQFGSASGGPSGGPVNSGRLPTQDNSAAAASTPASTGAARANRAIRGFQDSRVVNTCWQNLLRMNPSLRDASVRITLQVNGTGRFTAATVSGSPDPRFDSCLRGRLPTIAPIGAGEALDAQTTVNLTTGG